MQLSTALRRVQRFSVLRRLLGTDRQLAELRAWSDGRYAPRSETTRLDRAFDELAKRAPASEVERLNLVFDELGKRAPASEVERLNLVFDRLAAHELAYRELRDLVLSERCVEIPWVLSRYRGERRVLEIGFAYGEDRYVDALRSLEIPELVGLDLVPGRAELADTFERVLGDVREDLFAPGSFDLILCISTIEHIGRDNAVYGLATEDGSGAPDHAAIRRMAGWLADDGRLLLSVPFGKLEDQGWLLNYDAEALDALVDASGLQLVDDRYYELRGGWVPCDRDEVRNRGYRSLGAPHAGAVAMLELTKTP